MAFQMDAYAGNLRCEICGCHLVDEIVLQEFADGSQARICTECAAGASVNTRAAGSSLSRSPESSLAPNEPVHTTSAAIAVHAGNEAADRHLTEQLLTPVTDLIALQKDIQSALERLASSLERFAAETLMQSSDETAKVENRLRTLEHELEQTRKRLQDAEGLLSTAAAPPEQTGGPSEQPSAAKSASSAAPTTTAASPSATPPPSPVSAHLPVASPPPTGETSVGFTLEAVQLTQRYFNESSFVEKVRGVRRSLGKPRANLSRLSGHGLRVFLTIAWDIVWYQFVVDLARDLSPDQRVTLFREGMDLAELADHFRESNAIVDEDGRIDASELEVALLSDHSVLITEMTPEEQRVLEDATEEIWNQHTSPEFKWDD